MTTGQEGSYWLTMTEAARVCGVSRDTMKRHLRGRRFPNARVDSDTAGSPWRISLADLCDAGFTPRVTTRGAPGLPRLKAEPSNNVELGERHDGDSAEVLLIRLAAVRVELEAAERLAEARAEHIRDLRMLLPEGGGHESPKPRSGESR